MGGGVFVLLLAVYIVANYAAGLAISSRAPEDERGRNVLLGLAVAGNLSVLAVWKYASFVVTQLNGIAASSTCARRLSASRSRGDHRSTSAPTRTGTVPRHSSDGTRAGAPR